MMTLEEDEHYHDDDAFGKEMVKEMVEETRNVAKEVTAAFQNAIDKKVVEPLKEEERELKRRRKVEKEESQTKNRHHLEPGTCRYIPTQQETAISPDLCRVCATLSGQIYAATSKESFQLDLEKKYKPDFEVEVTHFFNNGKLQETTPALAIAVTGETMIAVWCGTRGTANPMDIVFDANFAPLASSAWVGVAPHVRAQGGILALVENYMCLYKEVLATEVKSRGIKNLILTGHSLGGGIAQVCHLYLQGERLQQHSSKSSNSNSSLSEGESLWSQSLNIHTVAFAAPMTTVNLKRSDKACQQFLQSCESGTNSTMCNVIYSMDVVPRGYACIHYINEVLKGAIPELCNDLPVPGFLKWAFGAKSKMQEMVESIIEGNKDLISIMVLYRHIGKIIYYPNDKASPIQLVDKGFFYKPLPRPSPDSGLGVYPPTNGKEEEGSPARLRDIEYERQSTEVLAEMHNFLVGNNAGPGLAYTPQV
jgi:hypothetical protein